MSACMYCGDTGAHPGTGKCSDSTACGLRVVVAERDALLHALDPRTLELLAKQVESGHRPEQVAEDLRTCAANQRAAIARVAP